MKKLLLCGIIIAGTITSFAQTTPQASQPVKKNPLLNTVKEAKLSKENNKNATKQVPVSAATSKDATKKTK